MWDAPGVQVPTRERLRSLTVDILVRCVFQRLQKIQLDEDGRAVLRFKSVTELAVEAWWFGTPTSSFTPSTQGESPRLPAASEPEPRDQQQIRLPPVPGPLHLHDPELDHKYQYAQEEAGGCEAELQLENSLQPKSPTLPACRTRLYQLNLETNQTGDWRAANHHQTPLKGCLADLELGRNGDIRKSLELYLHRRRVPGITKIAEIDIRSPFHVDIVLQSSLKAESENLMAKRCKLNVMS